MKAVYSLARVGDMLVIERSKDGDVKYLSRANSQSLQAYTRGHGEDIVFAMNNGYGPYYFEDRWVYRMGSHADSKKPMCIGNMRRAATITVDLPSGRHDKGYPQVA